MITQYITGETHPSPFAALHHRNIIPVYILSNNRNLTVVNLSVFLIHQQFKKHEFSNQIFCFETDELFFPLNSGEKNYSTRIIGNAKILSRRQGSLQKRRENENVTIF